MDAGSPLGIDHDLLGQRGTVRDLGGRFDGFGRAARAQAQGTALPLVLIIAALSAVLFHWGVMPLVVRAFAWALQRTMGLGGAVGVSAAANVFVGMVEAPLVIAPYLARLSRGELFIVMNCGMATIAGTVLVLGGVFLVTRFGSSPKK